MKKYLLIFIIGLFTLAAAALPAPSPAAASPAAPDLPETPAEAPVWSLTPTQISSGDPTGKPAIASNFGGATTYVVFATTAGSDIDRDPYYVRISNGSNFGPQTKLATPGDVYGQTKDMDIAYYTSGSPQIPYAIWAERVKPEQQDSLKVREVLFLAKVPDPEELVFVTQLDNNNTSGIVDPRIVITGDDGYVFWATNYAANQGDFNIQVYFKHFDPTDGVDLDVDPNRRQVTSGDTVGGLDVTADANGNLHLVWITNLANGKDLYYAFGNVAMSGTVTWSSPVRLDGTLARPERPAIVVGDEGRLHVTFTRYESGGTEQTIYHLYCNDNCIVDTQWRSITGAQVGGTYDNPGTGDIISSDLIYVPQVNNTVYAFYYGTPLDETDDDLFSLNDCDGWGASLAEVSPPLGTADQLYPDAAYLPIHSKLLLVYNENSNAYVQSATLACTNPQREYPNPDLDIRLPFFIKIRR